MIHVSGNLPSSETRGAPRSGTKWQVFIDLRVGHKLLAKEEIRDCFKLLTPLKGAGGLCRLPNYKVQIDWFKIPLLGEAETTIILGIKSQFGELALEKETCVRPVFSFQHAAAPVLYGIYFTIRT